MIQSVVNQEKCTGCGACFAVCPSNAITLLKNSTFFPEINLEKCTKCLICEKVCPSIKNNPFSIYHKNQKNKGHKFNDNIGNFENIYLAYSKNKDIRYNASSGGTITSFLLYLLEKKAIDAALLTYTNPQSPINPLIKLVTSKKEILDAKGSKYCPVPLCIGIKQIIESNHKKIAIVGLGCHISAISNYQKLNNSFNEKIFIKIGIVCGQYINYDGLNYFFKQENINIKNIKYLKYRGLGWPGKMVIKTTHEDIIKSYMKFFEIYTWGFFEPKSCLFCRNFTNESADISFSDAWIKEVMEKDQIGTNIVITRNNLVNDLFRQANELYYKEIDPDKMINSMWWRFFTKKNLKLHIHKKFIFYIVHKIFCFNSYISRHSVIVVYPYIHIFSKIFRWFRK